MKVLYLGIKRTANQVYTIKLKGEKLAREQLHNQAWNENGPKENNGIYKHISCPLIDVKT